MKFIIIGDSWGRGEWVYENGTPPYNQGKRIYVVPKTSIGSVLESCGHTCMTLAKASTKGSNYKQLLLLQEEISDELRFSTEPIDGIIWFHTETIRDIIWTIVPNKEHAKIQYPNFDISNFKNAMEYINTCNYEFAQQLYNQYNIPFYVIGCLSPLSQTIHNFNFHKLAITSWISEITGYSVDNLPLNMHEDFFLEMLDILKISNKKEINDEMKLMNKIETELDSNGMFSAGVHPKSCHIQDLATRILNVTNSM